jgi:hypothetical protein
VIKNTQGVDYEIIVVDNHSSDDSATYVAIHFSQVRFIRSPENLGFGKANNLGVESATGKYVFFLNSDTILLNNAVLIFFEYMEQHGNDEHLGGIGCYLKDNEGNLALSYGDFPSPKSEFSYIKNKILHKQRAWANSECDVDFITGADLFMPRKLFESLGGFDPQFFMYYEETELQYRFAKLGWKRRLIIGPEILHLEGGSFRSSGLSYKRFVMAQKSYNYYVGKHFSGQRYIAFRITLIGIRLLVFFTTTWSIKEKIKAYGIVLKATK